MGDIGEGAGVDEYGRALLCMVLFSISGNSVSSEDERTSSVCIRFGLIASFIRTANAPPTPRSSTVTGSPALLLATTILPNLATPN